MSWGLLLLGAEQNDSGNVAEHNADAAANPFAVTFGNLDGITANAVWNADEARLEF